MHTTVNAKNGWIEINAVRGDDARWRSELRYVSKKGAPTGWMPASTSEGFHSAGIALCAAILLGKHLAEEIDGATSCAKEP